jgi:hypothetical protein
MPSTALDDQRFERVAPTWEVGRPGPEYPTPAGPADRGVRFTIAAAIALALITATLAVATVVTGLAFGLPLGAGVGERTPHPQSAADLTGGFELGAGELRVDLRDVAFPAGTTRTKVEVGFGEATVIVPRGVEVVVDGEVLAGQAQTFGRAEDGLGVQTTQASGAGPRAPRLELDARVGFGQLRVERG